MNTEEIRKLLEKDKLVLGLERTKKSLGKGEIKEVLIASNAPEMEASALTIYAEMTQASIVPVQSNNKQLGTVCRKPFNISFIGVKK